MANRQLAHGTDKRKVVARNGLVLNRMDNFRLIDCAGSARDCGRIHGEQARDLIQANLQTYRKLFETRMGLAWSELRLCAERYLSVIRDFDEELLEEICGIAEGSAADVLDIVVLNARSSIADHFVDACTSIAHVPDSVTVGTLIGQNWDNMKRLRAVVLRVERFGSPKIVTLTEAGTLAKIGLNSAGIGLCVNGLIGSGVGKVGVPIFVMLRRVLQQTTVSGALAVISKATRDAPHNYLIATRQGAAFTVEAAPSHVDILPLEDRFLVHTNHVLSSRLGVEDKLLASNPDTVVRLWRARRLLSGYPERFTVDDMKTVLGDHFDYPKSICSHTDGSGNEFAMGTNCSVISDLSERTMHYSDGNPCEARWFSVPIC